MKPDVDGPSWLLDLLHACAAILDAKAAAAAVKEMHIQVAGVISRGL